MDENGTGTPDTPEPQPSQAIPPQPPPPPVGPPPPPLQGGYYPVAPPVPTNGLATAALVVGIVGLVLFWTIWLGFILGVLGIVFGILGRGKAKQGAPNGGLATAGLTLGTITVVVSILFLILVIAIVDDANTRFSDVSSCLNSPELC